MATPSKKVVTTMFVRMAMEMEGETNLNPIPTEEIKTTMALETTDHQIKGDLLNSFGTKFIDINNTLLLIAIMHNRYLFPNFQTKINQPEWFKKKPK